MHILSPETDNCPSWTGPLVQEKNLRIDFQDGSHLRLSIRTIVATFNLQITKILPSFKTAGLLVHEKKLKKDFEDGCHGRHLGFQIWTILYLQVALILPTKFSIFQFRKGTKQIFKMMAILDFWSKRFWLFSIYKLSWWYFQPNFENWPFNSRGEKLNSFPSWISNQNDFSYVWSTHCLDTSYKVSSQLAFLFRRRNAKQISSWPPLQPSWISNQYDFSCFLIYKLPQYFLPSFESIGLSGKEKKHKIDFQDGLHCGHFGFQIVWF